MEKKKENNLNNQNYSFIKNEYFMTYTVWKIIYKQSVIKHAYKYLKIIIKLNWNKINIS